MDSGCCWVSLGAHSRVVALNYAQKNLYIQKDNNTWKTCEKIK
jgi:hypothetical protein